MFLNLALVEHGTTFRLDRTADLLICLRCGEARVSQCLDVGVAWNQSVLILVSFLVGVQIQLVEFFLHISHISNTVKSFLALLLCS